MLAKINNHSPLTVKKEEAANGSAWNQLAKGRSRKQHGESEFIPPGDHHAVHTHQYDPRHIQQSSEEEQQALSSLENQIRKLQQEEKNRPAPPPPPARTEPKVDDFNDPWYDE